MHVRPSATESEKGIAMKEFKLVRIITISGTLEVVTGLHIGSGNDRIEIGGMDNPIIKNPVDKLPYIPGSSLKGKTRSLLELAFNKVAASEGKPCSCGKPDCPVCRVFGTAIDRRKDDYAKVRGPTRVIFRDAMVSEESKNRFKSTMVEEKNENSLNRLTAEANPRPIERVVPGVEFNFELAYRVFDIENDGGAADLDFFKSSVLTGLALMQNDYLGGGGSRGNGRIRFKNLVDDEGKAVELPGLETIFHK